jgi:2-succinyl-5-enolpyruvyl-6-hydroxy-3-cyclohexene-1-carboxylate synthase
LRGSGGTDAPAWTTVGALNKKDARTTQLMAIKFLKASTNTKWLEPHHSPHKRRYMQKTDIFQHHYKKLKNTKWCKHWCYMDEACITYRTAIGILKYITATLTTQNTVTFFYPRRKLLKFRCGS